jgi:hypothetical protein
LKQAYWFILGILACLLIAGGTYFWATGLIDSLYDFRSPLHAAPPLPGGPVGPALTRRVVLVLIDALRDDTSHKTALMPTLNELRAQGAWATMHSRVPSYSEPGYTVLLTGAWPDISDGPAMNLDYADIPTWTQDNLFSSAHRAGLRTGVSGFNWFEKLIPQADVSDSFYTPGEDAAADRAVMTAAMPMLAGTDQFVLIHLDQVDYAGHHQGGPRDPRWDEAAARSDGMLHEIAGMLDLKQDTLIVLSDHGQIDRGGHGGQDPIVLVEPFVMAGAGVRPGNFGGIQMVDVAPTIATLLGLNLPATNEGYVLTDMLSLPANELPAIQTALKAQQAQLFGAYTQAIGSSAPVGDDPNIVTATQAAIDRARYARLWRERIPRLILAVILAALPAVVLILRRNRKTLWPLGGALLYVLLFNLIYAFIAGRTYSLSSVASETDIIVFTAVTSTAALTVAWLLTLLGQKAFRQGASKAAGKSLAVVLMTIYILSLPILLGYAWNGILVTWTIPDLMTMFLGFLSILQALIVAAAGLVLTGATALIAALAGKNPR